MATLDRLSGLQENAQAQQMAYQQGGDAMLMSGMQGFAQGMGSMGGALMDMEGGNPKNTTTPTTAGANQIPMAGAANPSSPYSTGFDPADASNWTGIPG